MIQPILNVKTLSKSYKNKVILNDISFELYKGEIVALLGENGAGKSTLISIITHLIPQDSGHVLLFGKQKFRKNNRETIGVMLQHSFSLSKVTVKESIMLARSYYSKPLPYSELLSLAGLKEKEDTFLTKLSGGQQRRLSFSIALAGDPELIFLDEPTAGMDSHARYQFWQTVSHYQKQGKTFFITSHYLDELEMIATRFLILKNNSLTFNGTIEQLREKTGQTEINFTSSIEASLFNDFTAVLSHSNLGTRHTFLTNDINTFIKELIPYLNDLENLSIKPHSLETLFNQLSKGEN